MSSEKIVMTIFKSTSKWYATHQPLSLKPFRRQRRTNKAIVFLSRVFTQIPLLSDYSSVEKAQEDFEKSIQAGLKILPVRKRKALYDASNIIAMILEGLIETDMGESVPRLSKGEMPDLESDDESESSVLHVSFSRDKVAQEMEACFGFNLLRLCNFLTFLVESSKQVVY